MSKVSFSGEKLLQFDVAIKDPKGKLRVAISKGPWIRQAHRDV